MALINADRVFETTTTAGTADLVLAGALTGYRTFGSVCANNDTAYYTLWEVDSAGLPTGAWETGLGTWVTGGTLQRTTVHASSTGSKVSLAAGTKRVALGLTATALTGYQAALVSGTSIKTVNGTSLLGSGDVAVQAPIGTISGIAKGNGANALTAATAGTDYAAPGSTTTYTVVQNFTASGITLKGSSTGTTTFASANSSATNYTITFPAATGTVLTSAAAVTVGQGGTGLQSLTTGNVLVGNGSSSVSLVAPGTSGNVLTSNGSTWASSAPSVSASAANAFTGANSFQNAAGQTFLSSTTTTQDGVVVRGRAGGANSYRVTIEPTTLSASQTLTLPDASGTVLTTASAVSIAQGGTGQTSAQNAINALAGGVTNNRFLRGNGTNIALSQVTLNSADVTGILPASNGGTGNGFFAVSGPTTTTRTFTFPNADATVLTTNAAVSVAQGGTGLQTLTANSLLVGAGTSNVSLIAPGASGNILKSNGTSWVSSAPTASASGMTLISSSSLNNTSTVDLWFGATAYACYLIVLSGVRPSASSNGLKLHCTYNDTTTRISASTQLYYGHSIASTTMSVGTLNETSSNTVLGNYVRYLGADPFSAYIYVSLARPSSGGILQQSRARFSINSYDVLIEGTHYQECYGSDVITGVQLAMGTGSFSWGRINLFGLQNA